MLYITASSTSTTSGREFGHADPCDICMMVVLFNKTRYHVVRMHSLIPLTVLSTVLTRLQDW